MTLQDRVTKAVKDGRSEVLDWLERLAEELDNSATRIRDLQLYLDDPAWLAANRTAAPIARDLGRELRQPLGQNAQELLLSALASLAEDEGALRALSFEEDPDA